jgi:Aspartyl protease
LERLTVGTKQEWENFVKDTAFNGPSFILTAQINGAINANTLIDTGCDTYGIVSSHFVNKNQLERMKIRPQTIRGFDGPVKKKSSML